MLIHPLTNTVVQSSIPSSNIKRIDLFLVLSGSGLDFKVTVSCISPSGPYNTPQFLLGVHDVLGNAYVQLVAIAFRTGWQWPYGYSNPQETTCFLNSLWLPWSARIVGAIKAAPIQEMQIVTKLQPLSYRRDTKSMVQMHAVKSRQYWKLFIEATLFIRESDTIKQTYLRKQ